MNCKKKKKFRNFVNSSRTSGHLAHLKNAATLLILLNRIMLKLMFKFREKDYIFSKLIVDILQYTSLVTTQVDCRLTIITSILNMHKSNCNLSSSRPRQQHTSNRKSHYAPQKNICYCFNCNTPKVPKVYT